MTPEQQIELKAKIKDAEDQYHALMTGRMARVVVDQNGERVEFTVANRQSLYSYIVELKSLLPGEFDIVTHKPLRFIF